MRRGPGEVRRAVAAHRPRYRIESVVPLGAGLDHTAYEVNGELVVRFGEGSEREARLLEAVAAVSPVPVPRPLFADAECLAYPKLAGVAALDLAAPDRARHGASIAATLGRLLAALHAVAPDDASTEDGAPAEWLAEARRAYAAVTGAVPASHRPAVEAFLGGDPPGPAPERAFTHHDLGLEHVLVEPGTGTVTGVIDWTDAAFADTAYDFGLILRDLGPAAFGVAVEAYGPGVSEARALFYARCLALEDLAYGLRTGRDPYVDKSLAGMAWLFPA